MNDLNFGDILKTNFPNREYFVKNGLIVPHQEQYKGYRPCILLAKILDEDCVNIEELIVLYGTSQNININGKDKNNEFTLKINDEYKNKPACLSKPTKWIISPPNIARLPYDNNFFDIEEIRFGNLPNKKKEQLKKLINKDKIQKIINELLEEGNGLIPKKYWEDPEYNILDTDI